MSRKYVLEPIYITSTQTSPLNSPNLPPPSQSLSASFTILPTSVKFFDNLSYQIVVTTSDSTGNFELQGSNDQSHWDNLLACGSVAAANDTISVNINQFPFAFMRLKYTSSIAGTGTCTIVLMARSVGA